MKTLAICIPTFCRKHTLQKLLNQLFKLQKQESLEFDIYVCDNASTDGTIDYLEALPASPGFHWVSQSENVGIDRNMEKVMRLASARYIWPLADDLLLDEEHFMKLFRYLQDADEDLMLVERKGNPENYRQHDITYDNPKNAFKDIWGRTTFGNIVYRGDLVKEGDFEKYYDTFHAYIAFAWDLLAEKHLKGDSTRIVLKACPVNIAQKEVASSWSAYSSRVIYNGIPKMTQALPEFYNPYLVAYARYFMDSEIHWTNLCSRLFRAPVETSELSSFTQYLELDHRKKFTRFAKMPRVFLAVMIVFKRVFKVKHPSGFKASTHAKVPS